MLRNNNMTKIAYIAAIVASFSALPAPAATIVAEAGVSYGIISGVRPYSAPTLRQSETSSVAIPFVKASAVFSDRWRTGLGYSFIGNLRGSGVGSNIFVDDQRFVAQVAIPYTSTEDIHELSMDLCYALPVVRGVTFQLGPVASLFYSRAHIANRSFTDTELRIGAVADVRWRVGEKWEVGLGCKYSHPTARHITQLYASAGYRF